MRKEYSNHGEIENNKENIGYGAGIFTRAFEHERFCLC